MMELSFCTDFTTAYQRNRNSRTKTKNLRCFPGCCRDADLKIHHEQYGFCGTTVTVQGVVQDSGLDLSQVYAAARFCLSDEPTQPIDYTGEDSCRTKRFPTLSWITTKCTVTNSNTVLFKINPDLVGWHYDWKSSKKNRNTQHCLELCVFINDPNIERKLLATKRSCNFLLYSGNQTPNSDVKKDKVKLEPMDNPPTSKRKSSDSPNLPLSRSKQTELSPNENTTNPFVDATQQSSISKDDDGDEMTVKSLLRKAKQAVQKYAKEKALDPPKSLTSSPISDETDELDLLDTFFQDAGFLDTLDSEQNFNQKLESDLLQEVINILGGDAMFRDISTFLSECAHGPLGDTLNEVLKSCEENKTVNPFLREFARSLFTRFQALISKRLKAELLAKGYHLDDRLRGSTKTTRELAGLFDENGELVYDANDDAMVYSFLKMIKSQRKRDSIRAMLMSVKSEEYELINQTWALFESERDDVFANDCAEIGLMNAIQAKLMEKVYIRIAIIVQGDLVRWQGCEEFGGISFEIIADGQVHKMEKISFLIEYVELSPKTYIGHHCFDQQGNYQFDYCLWWKRDDVQKWFYWYVKWTVNKNFPDVLTLTRKFLASDTELAHDFVIPNARQEVPQYLMGQPSYESVYYRETM